ncbi:hypothetical protein O3P69_012907 [Scylla paramamosain]|uniref:TmcA/NAT10 N-terminal domain-containing protein n=1 Tax=Scylla paramamosain TaxID=85552 RepID=A0AAW0TTN3_SCYPA
MLSKSGLKQANVLWCYKKELTFSSHRRKRMKQLKAKIRSEQAEINEDDPFEMFVSMTDIRYCFYNHKILGNTYKMCVLQDFQALIPNILCRTMETVEGGGLIVLLLQSLTSLRQLYTLSMDVHARYRTEAHQHVVPRFNERFILSLASCPVCVVMDDHLRVLPISSHLRDLQVVAPPSTTTPLSLQDQELKDLKESLKDNPPIGLLIDLCKTLDQVPTGAKLGTCEEVERPEETSGSAEVAAVRLLPDFLEDLAHRSATNLTEAQMEKERHTLAQYADVFSRGHYSWGHGGEDEDVSPSSSDEDVAGTARDGNEHGAGSAASDSGDLVPKLGDRDAPFGGAADSPQPTPSPPPRPRRQRRSRQGSLDPENRFSPKENQDQKSENSPRSRHQHLQACILVTL